jgi:hypothetical protein
MAWCTSQRRAYNQGRHFTRPGSDWSTGPKTFISDWSQLDLKRLYPTSQLDLKRLYPTGQLDLKRLYPTGQLDLKRLFPTDRLWSVGVFINNISEQTDANEVNSGDGWVIALPPPASRTSDMDGITGMSSPPPLSSSGSSNVSALKGLGFRD